MSLLNECRVCSKSTSNYSSQCSHCYLSFCYQCLVKHHHNDVKNELLDMINQIDKILVKFLHHAHNQTEWTGHLSEDRCRLKNYIYYIEKCHKYLPIALLPSYPWLNHVNNLIRNDSTAIFENCCKSIDFSLNSFIKS